MVFWPCSDCCSFLFSLFSSFFFQFCCLLSFFLSSPGTLFSVLRWRSMHRSAAAALHVFVASFFPGIHARLLAHLNMQFHDYRPARAFANRSVHSFIPFHSSHACDAMDVMKAKESSLEITHQPNYHKKRAFPFTVTLCTASHCITRLLLVPLLVHGYDYYQAWQFITCWLFRRRHFTLDSLLRLYISSHWH